MKSDDWSIADDAGRKPFDCRTGTSPNLVEKFHHERQAAQFSDRGGQQENRRFRLYRFPR